MAGTARVFEAFKTLPLLLAVFLCGCSGAGITETIRSLQGGAAAPETPDFVLRSREGAPSGHIPVGVTPSGRPTPLRSAAEVQKLEKELDQQREQAQAFAHRPAPKSAYDGLSLPERPKAARPKRQPEPPGKSMKGAFFREFSCYINA